MGFVTVASKAAVEGFVGLNSSEKRRDAYVDFVAFIVAFIISIIILGFIGKMDLERGGGGPLQFREACA
jgi:hypothetical protein